MASILKNFHNCIINEDEGGYAFDALGNATPLLGKKIRRVNFIWITRDIRSWKWFSDMLVDLEQHEIGRNYLEIEIFVTNNQEGGMSSEVSSRSLRFGRPDWNAVFTAKAQSFKGKRVGVFFCGPKAMSTELKKACRKNSKEKTVFIYKKENF